MRKLMMIAAVLMVGVASVAGAQLKQVHDAAAAPRVKPALELRTAGGTLQHDVVLSSTRRVAGPVLEMSFEPAPYVD